MSKLPEAAGHLCDHIDYMRRLTQKGRRPTFADFDKMCSLSDTVREFLGMCEHGRAWDVHCCACNRAGFPFESDHVCPEKTA